MIEDLLPGIGIEIEINPITMVVVTITMKIEDIQETEIISTTMEGVMIAVHPQGIGREISTLVETREMGVASITNKDR